MLKSAKSVKTVFSGHENGFYQGFKSDVVKLCESKNFAYQLIDKISYLSVWEGYQMESHQTLHGY